MPLIFTQPYYLAKAGLTSFDTSGFIVKTNGGYGGYPLHFVGGKFYSYYNGNFWVMADASVGFTKVNSVAQLKYEYGFTKNVNTGRLFACATNDPNSNNSPIYMSDDDGVTWFSKSVASAQWRTVATDSNGIVIISTYLGNGGSFINNTWRSTDNGNTWANITSAAAGNDVMKYFDRYNMFIGGYGGTFRYSTNGGVTWTAKSIGSFGGAGTLLDILDDGTRLVMFTNSLTIPFLVSTDGINWTSQSINFTPVANLREFSYGSGLYVLTVQNSSLFYTSTDLVTWQQGTWPSGFSTYMVEYGNGQFVFPTTGTTYAYYQT